MKGMIHMTTETTDTTTPETLVETPQEPATTPEAPEATLDPADATGEPETFPREYVEKLRKENAGYRDKAKKTDDYAHQLHAALVKETGRLADPTDLPFKEETLHDPVKLAAAIDDLLATKPHLANRKPMGDIGQGIMSEASETISLAGLLRANAN